MRQGSNNQNNRRGRGRGHVHNNNPRRNNYGHRNQNYDSNGPLGRIRGTAKQIYDKYLQQAKDAVSSGDRILAESLHQHADHYGRLVAQFTPKPKPEDEQTDHGGAGNTQDNADTTHDAGDDTEQADRSDSGSSDNSAEPEEHVKTAEPVAEKPKRRAPTRRAPRKKVDAEDKPTLGGGTSAVPDFLARPVEVESADAKNEASAQESDAEEEKPKRRTRKPAAPRKTTTRRKKTDDVVSEDAPSSTEAEAAQDALI